MIPQSKLVPSFSLFPFPVYLMSYSVIYDFSKCVKSYCEENRAWKEVAESIGAPGELALLTCDSTGQRTLTSVPARKISKTRHLLEQTLG